VGAPCEHRLAGGLCFLISSRRDPDGASALVFHGSTEFSPIICGEEMAAACEFYVGPQKAVLRPCPYCGGRHRQGSGAEHICAAWSGYKLLLKDMRTRESPTFPEGTKERCYPEDAPGWMPRILWPKVKASILRRDGYACRKCGAVFRGSAGRRRKSGSLEVHHILPRSRGGSDHPGNLITLCQACHRAYTSELVSDLALEIRNERDILSNRAALRWAEGTQEWEEE
jgi:5-methylcytosine-specific restriction protein A